MRRGTLVAAGALVSLLVGVITLLSSGGATGVDAEQCVHLSFQSLARERMVTGRGERVVVIGDSYSVGLGLRAPETSWPSRLPGQVHVYGFSGSGFSAHASDCPGVGYDDRARHALRSGAGLVVVEGGLNDYDQPTTAVRAGFRSLMGRLHGRQVLVVGPPTAPIRAKAARRIDSVLRSESARADVEYLSMTGHRFDYLGDRLHLTAAGHRAFGSIVADAVAGH